MLLAAACGQDSAASRTSEQGPAPWFPEYADSAPDANDANALRSRSPYPELAGMCKPPAPASAPMGRPARYVRHELRQDDHLLPSRDSYLEIPLRCAVRDEQALRVLWEEETKRWADPSPVPNLEGGTIVLASAGSVSTTGHGIGIDSVLIRADTALIYVMRYAPGVGCVQGALVENPTDAVRIPPVTVSRFHETAVRGAPCLP